jgi:hypothetical protein
MDPNDIELKNIDKLFEYEKHSRFIDNLDGSDELKNFAKLYCKMYLQQQEVITLIESIRINN